MTKSSPLKPGARLTQNDDLRGYVDLTSIASCLSGEVRGQQVLCPGPGHSARDRSLAVLFSPSAPDGFVVHSFAGDDSQLSKDFIRSKLGWAEPWRSAKPGLACNAIDAPFLETAKRASAYARAIWKGSVKLQGTPADRYLRSRRISPSVEQSGALRFHPACPWRDDATQETIRVFAMIAVVRSISTCELTGVHRTRLTPDGHKVARRMLGRAAGAAIMLTPYLEVDETLSIGESIETSMCAFALGHRSVWAMGSAGSISTFPLLRQLRTLKILAETGDGGANARAIERVGNRYLDAGRQVIIVEPSAGTDLNDAIREVHR